MHYAEYRTILSPTNGMNLYRGCSHGCIYCDSRSKCYQMKHEFEDIEVKSNAAKLLDAQLSRKRTPCMVGTGAMSDPYIPLEAELRLTRQCLEAVRRHGCGLAIQTKSASILRDIDILRGINERAKCVVQMTLTTYDEELCRKIEPNVSATAERFSALCAMRDAGIPTVVWLSPILPYINDTEENLRGILDYCSEAGVLGIIYFGAAVTLREGDREYFYGKLDELFPGLKQKYTRAFGNSYICESPDAARLDGIFHDECARRGIIHDNDELFAYMHKFETPDRQLSMFE